jgi:NhaA family Na+:H+ antiporter
VAGHSLVHLINEGLMAAFFLLIGLELEREIYIGELSTPKNVLLPAIAALGGMLVPAAIYFAFNFNTQTQAGAGIPMATDIAFALGILSLLGKRVPASLKIFLTALAVIDDLGAIIVIAIFYTGTISWLYLVLSLSVFALLILLNKLKIKSLIPYLAGGVLMWYFMHHSGVHATITGVLLAFAIPFRKGDYQSPSWVLQRFLHKPVAFIVLPVFALANTAIVIGPGFTSFFTEPYALGIIAGLVIGKPLGITLFCFIAVLFKICVLPADMKWKHLIGAGMLGGIGFTMSIFITLLAFDDPAIINSAGLMILLGSLLAGVFGLLWLRLLTGKKLITTSQQ